MWFDWLSVVPVGIQVNFTFFLPTLFVMQCNTTSTSTRFHRAFLLKCFSLAGLYWDWDCVSLQEPTRHPVSQIKPALSFIFGSSSSVRSFSSWNVPGFIDKIFLVISNLKICNLMSASLQPFVSCIVLSMEFNGMEYLLAFALLPIIDFLCNNNWTKIRFPGEIHQNSLAAVWRGLSFTVLICWWYKL